MRKRPFMASGGILATAIFHSAGEVAYRAGL
jgi:hypothetical protein